MINKPSRRSFIEEAALIAAGMVLPQQSCKRKEDPYGPPKNWPQTPKKVTPKIKSDKHSGVNLTSWYYTDYSQDGIFDTLKELNKIGVNSIALPQTWYQENEHSTIIEPMPLKTPSFGGRHRRLENLIESLKILDMRTVLKPHVDLKNGGYRTDIRMKTESDWKKWFDSYREFIKIYATIAKQTGVDIFIIGTELKGTTHRLEWNKVIEDVRAINPGRIGYAANWDEYRGVPFWDELDVIGIDAYFPLTTKNNPSQEELDTKWKQIAQKIGDFSEKKNKKVIITEFGYQSLDGTNIKPSRAPTKTVDELEQAQCYSAILKALFNKPFIEGMYIWDIHWNMADLDKFSFLGKPAEKIVRETYQRKN